MAPIGRYGERVAGQSDPRVDERALLLAVAVLTFFELLAVRPCRADVFHLRHGGTIEGSISPSQKIEADVLAIVTTSGGEIRLFREDLQRIEPDRPLETEYERRAPRTENKVAAQWELAEWCRENRLPALRTVHLRRILELDPDCVEARHALGYTHIEGRWVLPGEIPRERGMEYFQGRWRLPQEIDAIEEKSQTRQAIRDWTLRLKNLRRSLQDQDRLNRFRIELAAIRDPLAIKGLLQLLNAEPLPWLRLFYVDVIARIEHVTALEALINTSLESIDSDVFYKCIDCLVDLRAPGVVDAYVLALRAVRNDHVNRAAYALGQLGDPASVPPLIEALVTRHRMVISDGSESGTHTATISRSVSGLGAGQENAALSVGKGANVVVVPMQNEEALTALHRITGNYGYGYDQRAWRTWYSANQRVPSMAPRRRE